MFRKAVIGLLVGAGVFLIWLFAWNGNGDAEVATGPKPKILLMTSLPIVWGEGASMNDILSGESKPSPIFEYWQQQYNIEAVDSLADLGISKTDIVLLAQPRAMDPADLSDLDSWVRAGGNALIFTDPALLWHSELPLGDSRRPLATGLLSPLLDHWGLKLNAPEGEETDIVELAFRNYKITTAGVGSFAVATERGSQAANCMLSEANIIAQCELGEGRIILVADADFIDETFWADDPDWPSDGKADAMRFTDDLITEFALNSPVSND